MGGQQQFLYEFGNVAKDPSKAQLWAWILGAHYLYLGEIGKQLLFWFTGGGMIIWFVIDLFTIKKKVQKRNEEFADKLLMRLK